MEPIDWSKCSGIEIDPRRQSGAPVFKGTRIPVDVVINNVHRGGTPNEIEEILENFDVTREQVHTVLSFIREHQSIPAQP